MKKSLQIALICFLLAGCGSTLKQGWNDFTAYYNTFYNAKQFYDDGLKANQRQIPRINPNKPIRIHPSPTTAGHDDFQEAIERASSILRDHQQSRYVNPAIAKIGRSFFYRTEYFAALEKFQELQTLGDSREQQEAILWQGRTYLEMENYAEGIQFLEIELDLRDDWDSVIKSEIGLVLTQLFVERGDWESSLRYIQGSIDGVEDRKLKSRGYFLFGQILEELDRNSNAVVAYRQIRDLRPEFDLEYNALKKEAEVSRKMGNYDRAIELFSNLERSDKFFEYRMDLKFELAQTHRQAGDTERAMELFQNILTEQFQTPDATVRARTYYGLAEIYRFNKDDFQIAAAYYDSAASERADESLLPDDFQAAELAESFGEYAEIQQQIAHNDSLLHLATLERAELDSVVAEIQERKIEEMERQEREMESQQQAVSPEDTDEVIKAEEVTEHGFLNVNNPVRTADASLQFQAVWGDRPLADNWRRRADVSGSRHDQFVIVDVDEEEVDVETEAEDEQMVAQAGVDLSEIPFSEAEREEMYLANEELYYRLGNVFFLSLDMPDNAREEFNRVLESSLNPDLTSRSYYTLAEIELAQDNYQEAEFWFEQLLAEFPKSVHTERLAERLNIEIELEEEDDTFDLQRLYVDIKNSDMSSGEQAKELQKIAYKAESESQRSEILFDAAKEYVKAAQHEHESEFGISEWIQRLEDVEKERSEFSALQDSARVMVSDTTLAEEDLDYWQNIADSTFAEPDLMSDFPFQGTYWDSTRSVLNHIETYYASSRVMPRVRILKETLEKPSAPADEEEEVIEEVTEEVVEEEMLQCSDLDITIDMDGGMEAFMNSISFPSWTDDISMRGELTYLFTIEPDGTIYDYEQVSRMDRSGIPQAVENAIEQLLQFHATGSDSQVECTETFPIDL